MPRISCLLSLATLGACAFEPPDAPTATEDQAACSASVLASGKSSATCPCTNPLTCQGNTNIVAGTGIWELDASMQEYNARGFKITGMHFDDSGVKRAITSFTVDGPTVKVALDNGTHRDGLAATGLHLAVHYRYGVDYELRILATTTVPYYLPPHTPLLVGYHIQYLAQDGPRDAWKDLCAPKPYQDHNLDTIWALFTKGDRIDPATGAVTMHGRDVGSWFQISCGEDVWTKVTRTHTGEAVAPATTPEQRTATSFMFTADYCGNAEHDTVVGTDIDWADRSENKAIGAVTAESVWTEHGALCLSTPRIKEPSSCPVPADCTADQLDHWDDYGWLKSGTP